MGFAQISHNIRMFRSQVVPFAGIIHQIKAQKIPAVFLENISDDRLIRRIAAETGAKVGGTLYSDSLTGEKGPAPTYIDLVRHNIKALISALGQ